MPPTQEEKAITAAPEQSIVVNSGGYQNVVKVGFFQTDLGRAIIGGLVALAAYVLAGVTGWLLNPENVNLIKTTFDGPIGDYSGLWVPLLVSGLVGIRSRYFDKTTPRVERLSE